MAQSTRNATTRPRERTGPGGPIAAQGRRDRRVRLVLLAVVGAVLLGIVGVFVMGRGASSDPHATANRTGAALPAGVNPGSWGVTAFPEVTPKPGAPTLEVWEDFQCPACAATELLAGESIEALARKGDIRLVWRPTTFLDERLGNNASLRAVAAWGCAIDSGVAAEYHGAVFEAQPAREGAGFTDAQLRSFGRTAGLDGESLRTFERCTLNQKYRQWALNSTAAFFDKAVPGTPTGYLNGKQLPAGTLADKQALLEAVRAAT